MSAATLVADPQRLDPSTGLPLPPGAANESVPTNQSAEFPARFLPGVAIHLTGADGQPLGSVTNVNFEISVPTQSGSIKGRILTQRGAPLPQREVTLTFFKWASDLTALMAPHPCYVYGRRVVTDGEGKFRLDRGELQVRVLMKVALQLNPGCQSLTRGHVVQ